MTTVSDEGRVELTGKKVLVTGASGRVGQRLAAALSDEGAIVRTVSIPGDPARGRIPAPVEIIEGSLTDRDVVARATEGIDVLVHLAALMDWSADARDRLFEANIRGTYLLLDAVSLDESGVDRVVIASSDEVYPALRLREPSTEDMALSPYSFYGLTKQADEQFARFYHRAMGLPVAITRFALTAAPEEIGRHDGWSGRLFFASGVRNLMAGLGRRDAVELIEATIPDLESTLILPRDASGRAYSFQFCDVRDLVHGLLRVICEPRAVGETFNLAGPQVADYAEIVPRLANKLGLDYLEMTVPGDRFNVRTDISKARELIGYRPVHDPLSIVAELAS